MPMVYEIRCDVEKRIIFKNSDKFKRNRSTRSATHARTHTAHTYTLVHTHTTRTIVGRPLCDCLPRVSPPFMAKPTTSWRVHDSFIVVCFLFALCASSAFQDSRSFQNVPDG